MRTSLFILFAITIHWATYAQSVKKETIKCGNTITQTKLFDENKNLVEQNTLLNVENNHWLKETFSFENNILKKSTCYYLNNIIADYEYIYDNKLLIKKIERLNGFIVSTTTFEYDSNNVVFENTKQNNGKIISIKFKYYGNNIIERSETIDFDKKRKTLIDKYSYNDKNLLCKKTHSDNVSTTTYTYFYDENSKLKTKFIISDSDTLSEIRWKYSKNGLKIKETHLSESFIVREETSTLNADGYIKRHKIIDYRVFTKSGDPKKLVYKHKYEFF